MIRLQQTGTRPNLGVRIRGTLADHGSCYAGPDRTVFVDLEIDVAPSNDPYVILLGLSDESGDPLPMGPEDDRECPENVQLHLTPIAVRELVEQLQALLVIADLGADYIQACRAERVVNP